MVKYIIKLQTKQNFDAITKPQNISADKIAVCLQNY